MKEYLVTFIFKAPLHGELEWDSQEFRIEAPNESVAERKARFQFDAYYDSVEVIEL